MPNTKLSRETIKNHMHYSKWFYVLIAVGAFFLGDLLFTTTTYRPPAERKVVFEIVGEYLGVEPLQAIADEIMLAAAEIDPTLEEISVYSIQYSGDAETDIYGAQKYMVMVAAREGDIYMLSRALMEQLATQGALSPLDEYIEAGLIDVDGLDMESVALDEPVENEDDPPTGVKHVYAIPATRLNRMLSPDIMFDNRDKYFVLMSYSANPETSVKVMQRMMDALTAPEPVEAEAQPTRAPEGEEAA